MTLPACLQQAQRVTRRKPEPCTYFDIGISSIALQTENLTYIARVKMKSASYSVITCRQTANTLAQSQ